MIIDLTSRLSIASAIIAAGSGGGGGSDAGYLGTFPDSATLILAFPTAAEGATAGVMSPDQTLWAYNGGWADTGIGFEGDMLKAIYDPTNQQVDVYDKANETGLEQITGGIITPPVLTADVDDYNPTGFATANMVRLDCTNNNSDITGLVAPAVGVNRIVRICNISTTSDNIRFQHNNVASAAANRFLLQNDGNRNIQPNQTAAFWYDHTVSRWRPYNQVT